MSRNNYICFTSYESERTTVRLLKASHAHWFVYQVEMCPDTGEFHLQGMAHANNGSYWKPLLTAAIHISKTIDPAASYKYCTKEETRVKGQNPVEYGDRPKLRGRPTEHRVLVKDLYDYTPE